MADPAIAVAQERVALLRQAEKEDAQERAYESFTEDQVRDVIGEANFFQAKRVVESHLASLSGDERARVEEELRHSPEKTVARWSEIVGLKDLPKDPKLIDAELVQIQKRMREDRKGYFADDRMQIRFRALVRAKDATKAK